MQLGAPNIDLIKHHRRDESVLPHTFDLLSLTYLDGIVQLLRPESGHRGPQTRFAWVPATRGLAWQSAAHREARLN